VLGQTVVKNLYTQGEDPVGRYVLVNNIPFQVVGVLAAKGATTFGSDMDDTVFMPLSTGRMRLFGRRYVRAITVQVADVERIDETEKAITELLTARHKRVDFQVRNTASLLETATETQNTLTVLLGSIAAISLLVGGIGIMNIMLASVTERTREIGIRRALGAKRRDIVVQFLVETVLLSGVGGVIGVVVGVTIPYFVTVFTHMKTIVTFWSPMVAFTISAVVGVVFGIYPALRAAHMNPVEALRHE
jgi:macrolide transport system ATP-binding/permease protein